MKTTILKMALLAFIIGLAAHSNAQTNIWTNANGTGLWSDPDNWSEAHSPDGTEALIQFDGTSTADCLIDGAADLSSTGGTPLTMTTAYTGTLTLDDNLTMEIATVNLLRGTITCNTGSSFIATSFSFGTSNSNTRAFNGTNAASITINGTLNMGSPASNNATFNASSNTTDGTTVTGAITNPSNGTFNHNNGKFTIQINSNGLSRTIPARTFHRLQLLNNTSGTVTFTAASAITINENLQLSSTNSASTTNYTFTSSGALNIAGSLDVSGHTSTNLGTTTLPMNMSGTTAQTIIGASTAGAGATSALTITNTASTVTLASGSLYVGGNFTINSSATFITNDNTVSFGGNVTNSGTFTPGTSTIFFRGAATQAINWGTATINTLTCSKTSGTATINSATTITDLMTCTGGTLNMNGNVTLQSNSTKTANFGSSAGTVSGNATVQRFISSSGRRYRFLASPVIGATMSSWISTIHISGTGGAANNFDATAGNQASVFTYNEALTTGDINTGWTGATNGTTQALTLGTGFRVFVRGSRSGNKIGAPPYDVQDEVTLSVTGALQNSNFTFSPTFNSSGTIGNDGWNLLGNPFACSYNWNGFFDGGTNRTNIDPTIYIYDGTTNAYLSFNATSNSGGLSGGIIPSGSAFFIKATGASPALTFPASFRVTTDPTGTFKTIEPEFSIRMQTASSNEEDKFFFKVMPGSTDNYDNYDIKKLNNANLNISAYGEDKQYLTSSIIPELKELTIIPLRVTAATISTYKFSFSGLSAFTSGDFVLIDKFKNTTTDLNDSTTYSFTMDSTVGSYGDNRFEIAITRNRTSIDKYLENLNRTYQLNVYPNPVLNELNIEVTHHAKIENISVFDISGKQVSNTTMNTNKIDVSNLNSGTYFIEVMTDKGRLTSKFIK